MDCQLRLPRFQERARAIKAKVYLNAEVGETLTSDIERDALLSDRSTVRSDHVSLVERNGDNLEVSRKHTTDRVVQLLCKLRCLLGERLVSHL